MATVGKVAKVAVASVGKVAVVAKASIGKVSGLEFAEPPVTMETTFYTAAEATAAGRPYESMTAFARVSGTPRPFVNAQDYPAELASCGNVSPSRAPQWSDGVDADCTFEWPSAIDITAVWMYSLGASYLTAIKIEYWDGAQFVEIGTMARATWNAVVATKGTAKFTFSAPVSTTKLKFTVTDRASGTFSYQYIHVEVNSPPMTRETLSSAAYVDGAGGNLARAATFAVASTWSSYVANNMKDGTSANWQSADGTGEYIEIDFGSSKTITGMAILCANSNVYINQMEISTWNGSAWVFKHYYFPSSPLAKWTYASSFQTQKIRIDFVTTAAYLFANDGTYLINEVEVYGS